MLRNSTLDSLNTSATVNPWSPSSTFVNLGSLHRFLSLAEQTGHFTKDLDSHDEVVKLAQEKSRSVIMIQILKGQSLDKINLEIQRHVRDLETIDITDVDKIGKRTFQMQQVSTHLSAISTHKDDLITRLQEPFVGNYLVIDAAYHKEASMTLPELASCLAAFPKHLENIDWSNSTNIMDGRLDNVLSAIESSFADLESHFRAAQKSRKAMKQMQEICAIKQH
ncbi:predicted protein [Nematostella vectensis]|uniref:Uncharacterized protein n=1 Tax=Nematostella vectensis TaxID=45351 RepID=A7RUF1_NEMVE|nr:predicted protein [Nematostella vectensis]|eukprot:XP_001636907.1 predicted protein [Nematostella vectensis]